jgi:hypothetical protein
MRQSSIRAPSASRKIQPDCTATPEAPRAFESFLQGSATGGLYAVRSLRYPIFFVATSFHCHSSSQLTAHGWLWRNNAGKTLTPSGSTAVTVVLSSTANDQLSEFDLGFTGITLTSQSGKTVTLLPTFAAGSGPGTEFMHMNGMVEPLASASIPQDVYTAATVALNGAQFVVLNSAQMTGNRFSIPALITIWE